MVSRAWLLSSQHIFEGHSCCGVCQPFITLSEWILPSLDVPHFVAPHPSMGRHLECVFLLVTWLLQASLFCLMLSAVPWGRAFRSRVAGSCTAKLLRNQLRKSQLRPMFSNRQGGFEPSQSASIPCALIVSLLWAVVTATVITPCLFRPSPFPPWSLAPRKHSAWKSIVFLQAFFQYCEAF